MPGWSQRCGAGRDGKKEVTGACETDLQLWKLRSAEA